MFGAGRLRGKSGKVLLTKQRNWEGHLSWNLNGRSNIISQSSLDRVFLI